LGAEVAVRAGSFLKRLVATSDMRFLKLFAQFLASVVRDKSLALMQHWFLHLDFQTIVASAR